MMSKKYYLKEFASSLKNKSENNLEQQVKALYFFLGDFFGAEELVMRAGKMDALPLIRSGKIEKKVLGLQKVVFEDPTLDKLPERSEIPLLLNKIEDKIASMMARKALVESIEQRVNRKMQERYEDYILDLKRELLKEQGGPENPQTLKKYALLEKIRSRHLSRSAMEQLRPQSLEEIVGQERGVAALMSKIASPFPQHIIIYGPPGVGKTAAARLALEAAKKMPHTPFPEDAPFVEVDGTTLRWDPREASNPLLGSVHDPIYQGAKKDLIEGGIPEPKPGLVTEAHAGVLFIDEIGEMDIRLQNKLLKVLEDKKVILESSYYDPSDPQVPKYIKEIFENGLPADFLLVGATTRSPQEISPALRSRCTPVYFEPLSPADIRQIARQGAARLNITLTSGAEEIISQYTNQGRTAVNLLADAYGLLLYKQQQGAAGKDSNVLDEELMLEVIRSNRLTSLAKRKDTSRPRIGRVFGLATAGYSGSVLEIEAVAFPASLPGKGRLRFNEAAGTMARDSVYNAASVLRYLTGMDINDFDLHINIVGGANVDGPSAGVAVFLAIYSAVKKVYLRQDMAFSGELSLQGFLKPVGGLAEKVYGAQLAGIQKVLFPRENMGELPSSLRQLEIIYASHVREVLQQAVIPMDDNLKEGSAS